MVPRNGSEIQSCFYEPRQAIALSRVLREVTPPRSFFTTRGMPRDIASVSKFSPLKIDFGTSNKVGALGRVRSAARIWKKLPLLFLMNSNDTFQSDRSAFYDQFVDLGRDAEMDEAELRDLELALKLQGSPLNKLSIVFSFFGPSGAPFLVLCRSYGAAAASFALVVLRI